MNDLLFFFLENMALIIALMYLALKLKETLLVEWKSSTQFLWLSSAFFSFLSFSVMHNPFIHEGMRLDLREVPIFFISYIGGWPFGILSAIVPGIFRASLGGPTVVEGILQSLILPIIIGALFREKVPFNHLFIIINIKRMLTGFVVFEFIKSIWMIATTPATLFIVAAMFFFAGIAVLAMSLILNGENRNLILRRELEFYSNQDPMTHLPNIRFFKNKVGAFVDDKQPLSIAMVDVDYFKVYNDTHGHQKGDQVLRTIGQLLIDSTSDSDVVARYGGEEFIICFTGEADPEKIFAMADKVRQNIESHRFEGEELQPGGIVSVSVGLSFSDGTRSLDQLTKEADKALYQSKNKGRNCVTLYEQKNENLQPLNG
ncbi:GGDEF domain-containing protein [Planococcus ruber]|uniref:GGDEF domain-containing protein n=1 Tax=Planococcus ruber TaxID=2027871 RepID=UPI001FEF4DFA|nr:diguanylate cyclase [Planococcus ruber]MCJ1909740.1 diguanylate cyclase [Planococcus ruber]